MEPRRVRPLSAAWAGVELWSATVGSRDGVVWIGGAVGALRAGDVEGRVPVEESDGLEDEAAVVDGHDRPVLGARDVGEPEGVPDNEVPAVDVAVRGDVSGQSG